MRMHGLGRSASPLVLFTSVFVLCTFDFDVKTAVYIRKPEFGSQAPGVRRSAAIWGQGKGGSVSLLIFPPIKNEMADPVSHGSSSISLAVVRKSTPLRTIEKNKKAHVP